MSLQSYSLELKTTPSEIEQVFFTIFQQHNFIKAQGC